MAVFLSTLNLDGIRGIRSTEDAVIDSWLSNPDFLLDADDFNEDAGTPCNEKRGWYGTKPGCKRKGKGGKSKAKTRSALGGGFKGLGSGSSGSGKKKATQTRSNTARQVAMLKGNEKLQEAVAKRFEKLAKTKGKKKEARKLGKMLKAAGTSRGYLNSVMKGPF